VGFLLGVYMRYDFVRAAWAGCVEKFTGIDSEGPSGEASYTVSLFFSDDIVPFLIVTT